MKRIEQINDMLQKDPQDPFLHYALAVEHMSAGDHDAAMAKFQFLFRNFPDYLATYYQAGQLAERMNDLEAAKQWYNNGIVLARSTGQQKALSELSDALWQISDED